MHSCTNKYQITKRPNMILTLYQRFLWMIFRRIWQTYILLLHIKTLKQK
uniref:Uncharacterized protein n=1 Tax=Arundo donax TaxID=35708 RepID=A0A0A9A1C9_ARUDO